MHRKASIGPGEIVEVKIWSIPRSANFPDGLKYSLLYAREEGDAYVRVLGVDNAGGKGAHERRGPVERPIPFGGMSELLDYFYLGVVNLRGEAREDPSSPD